MVNKADFMICDHLNQEHLLIGGWMISHMSKTLFYSDNEISIITMYTV